MILVKRCRANEIDSSLYTIYLMFFGTLIFYVGGLFTGGVRLVTEPRLWLFILGLSLLPTMVSNLALVNAINKIGPTLTSVFGALEPLTAVVLGAIFFDEKIGMGGIVGFILIFIAVTVVILYQDKEKKRVN